MKETQNMSDTNTQNTFTPPRHWIGVEELSADYWNDPKIIEKRAQEFHDKPVETLELIEKLDSKGIARRDFLTIMGASMAMASFACARRPVHKIIPYVVKPEEVTGGVANWYATSCPDTGYGILAKVREGRPIKLEGSPEHAISRGKLNARGYASLLDLYDMDRAKAPRLISRQPESAKDRTWEEADSDIATQLKKVAAGQGRVRILSGRVLGDSTQRLINEFLSGFKDGEHVQYDAQGFDDVVIGQERSYGNAVVPHYHFEKADVVVSFGSDFLGTSHDSVIAGEDWGTKRKLSSKNHAHAEMSKLFVVESMMSTTGANADERLPVKSGDEYKIAAAVAHEIARKKGSSVPSELASYTVDAVAKMTKTDAEAIRKIANALMSAAGKSIVVAGSMATKTEHAVVLQVIVNAINSQLGNEGKTIDGVGQPWTKVGGTLEGVRKLIKEMYSGSVDVLVIYKSNPIYALPKFLGFSEALAKVPAVIVVGDREDETAKQADYLLPDHHFLENWGDAQPKKGIVSLQQPTLAPVHNTRAFQDTLFSWINGAELKVRGLAATKPASWYDYLRANWKETYLKGGSFESQWEVALRDGVIKSNSGSISARSFKSGALSIVPALNNKGAESLSLAVYHKISLGDGRSANNPWLQEMPDPVTTATWDNYVCISPKTADKLGLKLHDVVDVIGQNFKTDLPVLIQPGLHEGTVAIAAGYGRTAAGKVGNGVGRDVTGFATIENGLIAFSGQSVKLQKTGRRYQIAITQWHNATENRPIVNDITLAEFKANAKTANHTDPHMRLDEVPTMWGKFKYPGYRWGMSIDLNACTGCGACIISCQSENNIPVVGRENVRKSREMHWIRLDRYYSGDAENPDVVFQPMICQHCENAPCETVCPVLATVHDDEGMNSQIYNRCVGTRYCQNNCPYKVRRFNFFDHWKSYEGSMNLAWNPDVTVRTRGIMEKCTFCVQRIRTVKDKAKDEGRKVLDGEIKTACQQACPAEAITFGDMNDKDTLVARDKADARAFRVLEVLNTVPSVSYLTKVRNKEGSAHGHSKGHGGDHHG